MKSETRLAILLLLKRRGYLLPAIYTQVKQLADKILFSVLLDQPDQHTLAGFEEMRALGEPDEFLIADAPFPPTGPGGERWMDLRELQRAAAEDSGFNPTHGVLWDDDHLLSDVGEARASLPRYDLVYATKMFLWDSTHHYNAKMPQHRSAFFYRFIPGDKYPGNARVIHAPVQIHDNARTVTDLKAPLRDFGYLHKKDREAVFRAYAQAGKIDSATRPLVEPPDLRPIEEWA